MRLDKDRSTVQVYLKTYPACYLICPQVKGREESETSELERAFALPWNAVCIPAENGVIFEVRSYLSRRDTYDLRILAHTCRFVEVINKWVPYTISLVHDSHLMVMVDKKGTWAWTDAEPAWVEETIDRFSVKRFLPPPGPRVKPVKLSYFDEDETSQLTPDL